MKHLAIINHVAPTSPSKGISSANAIRASSTNTIRIVFMCLTTLCSIGVGTAQTVSFDPAVDFAASSVPTYVAIGDLNGDGLLDLAAANSESDNVSILLGDGTGEFYPAPEILLAGGSYPYSVTIGLFNGDGFPDLAVANYLAQDISVLLGVGDGTFGTPTNFVVGAYPASIVIGEFDGDDSQDLAVANFGSGSISILVGDGNGGFSNTEEIFVGGNAVSVAAGQINGDGIADLVVARRFSDDVSVLAGSGNGGFNIAANLGVGSRPVSVATGDLNPDVFPDLVVVNHNSHDVSVLINNGDGTFGQANNFAAGLQPISVAIADLNGDGFPDVTVANLNSQSVSVLLGDGYGALGPPFVFAVGQGPYSIASGDFNGDGRWDLVAANSADNNVSILLNATSTSCLLAENPNQSDSDGDGVGDACDICPVSTPDTMTLNPNQWGWFGPGLEFTQGKAKKGTGGSDGSYSMSDTQGCSCTQIVGVLGLGGGHLKKGCSNSAMADWMAYLVSGKRPATERPAEASLPTEYTLDPAYPNPFNPQATIGFALPEAAHVSLVVYDVMGRRVRVLVDGDWSAGRHTAVFDVGTLPSGTYLVQLTTPNGRLTRTVYLVK